MAEQFTFLQDQLIMPTMINPGIVGGAIADPASTSKPLEIRMSALSRNGFLFNTSLTASKSKVCKSSRDGFPVVERLIPPSAVATIVIEVGGAARSFRRLLASSSSLVPRSSKKLFQYNLSSPSPSQAAPARREVRS
jgi:hypothetical protein